MLETRQSPKCLTRDATIHEILNIVPHFIIRHWTLHYVISVLLSMSARRNKVEPLISHRIKDLCAKPWIRTILINANYVISTSCHGPTLRLSLNACAIETKAKVLVIAYYPYFWLFHHHVSSMV